MCVIIVKNKGVEMPSKKELKLAFEHNPHGWGIVSSNGIYAHGMTFDSFLQKIKGVSTEDACIIHFRIATHGSVGVKNCHPFKGELGGQPIYFAHNGILPIRPVGDMTDSETEFRKVILPAAEIFGYGSPDFNAMIARRIGYSKFAFMRFGKIKVYGRWLREDNGLMWSNLNHRTWGYCATVYDQNRVIYV